jgi:hypothetical protein
MTANDTITHRIKELWGSKNLIENSIKESKLALDEINNQLNDIVKPEVSLLRDMQNKETGTVSLNINGSIKIKHTIPKKVKWSQSHLADLADTIIASGANLNEYMAVKYDVPEKLWSNFDSDTQQAFQEARTVEYGKPTIEIEILEAK